jgi:hypothetical protein
LDFAQDNGIIPVNKNMDIQTIHQIIIVAFGAIALICATSVMNKSETKGFGVNNKLIFGSIILLTFSGWSATQGGETSVTAAILLIGTVAGGFYGSSKS